MKILLLLIFFQQPDSLSLDKAIRLAQEFSLSPKKSEMELLVAQTNVKYLDAEFKPQLSLGATLPQYYKTTSAVTQPDGTISFVPISQDNSSLNLQLTQRLRSSNTRFFAETRLRRYQDFTGSTQYNSVPFRIGIEQPLNFFNAMKWDKKLADLSLDLTKAQWRIRQAKLSSEVTTAFFELLSAQVNLEIARTNARNSEKIYQIALERDKLGKISKSDLLQLELSLHSAEQSSINAKREVIRANANLKELMGYGVEEDEIFVLKMPEILLFETFLPEATAEKAWANRPEKKQMEKLLLETERALKETRQNHSWQGSLSATLGWVGTGARFPLSYEVPQMENLVQVTLRVPILDGGKKQWSTKSAQAQLEYTQLEAEYAEKNFKQMVRQWVHQYEELKAEVEWGAKSLAIARQRYDIANQRYLLNDISITDLSIAFSERDQAWRNYTQLLRAYWVTYYTLKQLTL
ncbi:TolC family protein [Leadbetterella byssophila]|uniref:TolC family protein n=1 Tax=Leadbetterella byssophila TaxID=316068 RepID=UPI0039A2ECA8